MISHKCFTGWHNAQLYNSQAGTYCIFSSDWIECTVEWVMIEKGLKGPGGRGHQRTGCLNDFKNIVENRRFPFYFWPSRGPVVQEHTRATRKISVHENNSLFKIHFRAGKWWFRAGTRMWQTIWSMAKFDFFKLIEPELNFIWTRGTQTKVRTPKNQMSGRSMAVQRWNRR